MATPETSGVLTQAVLATWRAVRLARLAESVLLGATALGIGLAAAVVSGPRGRSIASWTDVWGVAAIGALACALAWWCEHRSRPAAVAARIDRRLRLGGALVTGFEIEGRLARDGRAPSGVGRLLIERTARRAARRDCLRVALPRSGPFLAPPLIAAGLLAAALDFRRETPATVALSTLHAGLAGEASALGTTAAAELRAGELTPGEVRAALDLAARAGRLERRAAEAAGEAGEERAARESGDEASALRDELEQLLTRIPPGSETARVAERAAAWADLAARGARDGGDPTGDFDGTPKPEVAVEPGDGTMSGSTRPAASVAGASDGSTDPSGPSAAREAERGVAADRWWPERYDGVVERWVEARRARLRHEHR